MTIQLHKGWALMDADGQPAASSDHAVARKDAVYLNGSREPVLPDVARAYAREVLRAADLAEFYWAEQPKCPWCESAMAGCATKTECQGYESEPSDCIECGASGPVLPVSFFAIDTRDVAQAISLKSALRRDGKTGDDCPFCAGRMEGHAVYRRGSYTAPPAWVAAIASCVSCGARKWIREDNMHATESDAKAAAILAARWTPKEST